MKTKNALKLALASVALSATLAAPTFALADDVLDNSASAQAFNQQNYDDGVAKHESTTQNNSTAGAVNSDRSMNGTDQWLHQQSMLPDGPN